MDFFSNLAKTDESKPTSDPDQPHKPSNFDLFNSAKLVAEAAQAQFGKEPAGEKNYDNAKVASAAADLLGGVSDYGKLDDTKGFGKYVDQAEDYLRQYGTPHCAAAASTTTVAASGEEIKATTVAASTTVVTDPMKKEEGESGGSGADYMKVAGDFLNKPSGGGEEGGGAGGFMKLAGDFIKK